MPLTPKTVADKLQSIDDMLEGKINASITAAERLAQEVIPVGTPVRYTEVSSVSSLDGQLAQSVRTTESVTDKPVYYAKNSWGNRVLMVPVDGRAFDGHTVVLFPNDDEQGGLFDE